MLEFYQSLPGIARSVLCKVSCRLESEVGSNYIAAFE